MTTNLQADLIASNGTEFNSSNIDVLGYDREGETLFVEFQSGDSVYAYADVAESTYNLLVNSESVGRFYIQHIQGNYTATRYDDGFIVAREEEEEPYDYQPTRKWLTANGEDSPFSPTYPTLAPSRYGVKYTVEANGAMPSGPFEPEFEAMSEADALVQFNSAIASMEKVTGMSLNTKILAVTHYFD